MKFDQVMALMSQFTSLQPEDFQIMMQKCSSLKLKKNELWEKEGAIGKHMGFVNKGILRQYYLKDGKEFTQTFYAEGEFVGNYISYMTKTPSNTTIQALEDCELLIMTYDDLQKLYDEIPRMDRFGRLYAEKLIVELYTKSSAFLKDSPEERYAQLLKDKPDIHARVKQYYIAQYLGIQPESLSRIRKRWMVDGGR